MEYSNKKRVVVTGLGVVSSVGIGWRAFWDSLLAGRSGIRRISYIDTASYPTHYGGEVANFDPLQFMPETVARRLGRGSQFAIAATKLALEDARLSIPSNGSTKEGVRIGVCLGTTMADIQALESMNQRWVSEEGLSISSSLVTQYPSCTMSANVATFFSLTGPNLMIPTACAAGNYALANAFDLLQLEKSDIMIAGAAEPFSRIIFSGFTRLLAVAPDRCQPFDKNRRGMMSGEGAGLLVLERLEDAVTRNAPIYAEVLGYGLSCDSHKMTIPEVEGLVRVMENALHDAGIEPSDVNYISAHGTGTPANDRTECAAIREVFGSHTDHMPVSSIKSMLGHTMGAASALESIACVLAVHNDQVPPTINYETPDPDCDIDCVPNINRRHEVIVALNNSFAFGGNNACVVFDKALQQSPTI